LFVGIVSVLGHETPFSILQRTFLTLERLEPDCTQTLMSSDFYIFTGRVMIYSANKKCVFFVLDRCA